MSLDPKKFKVLEFEVEHSLVANQKLLKYVLDSFNNRFKPNELRIFCNENILKLWLREVSIDYLDDAIERVSESLTEEFGADVASRVGTIREIQNRVHNIKSYGLHGNKRLFVGYNKERKVLERKSKESRRGKHFYANDHSFSHREQHLPKEYRNKILMGDSEQVLRKFPDSCIDLVFTSPPYNFGLSYHQSNDATDWTAYFNKLFAVLDECVRVLKFGGRLIINVQPLFSDYIPSHHIIANHLMKEKMIWKGEILWEKNNYNCKYTAWGSWKSPSSPYLKYTWEFIEVFCKGDLRKPGIAANADITAEAFKDWVVAKWSIAPERSMKKYNHPAMFPEELVRRVLLLFSFRGDVVLDPFAGVGTTCVVSKKNSRDYVGIDLSSEYCNTAQQRIDEFLI